MIRSQMRRGPCAEPLPGYKKVNPMVYCGLYPADGAKYPDLRDALEKLQLNDAALQFEAETSVALGFGFRCGFLGLLHLEIVQERLEREYNLDLVTTAPSVIYKIHKTNGEVIDLTNPTNMPDPAEIEYMEEPMVKAEIMVTSEFIGAIMDLCQERRGVYQGMEYIEEKRAVIHYHLPLNEIIYDFFDALKSRSRGYASFDYEMLGYEQSELVKLDILINKEKWMHFPLLYTVQQHMSVEERCARSSKKRFQDSFLRSRSRQQWEARSSQERPSEQCEKTCLPSAMAVIFPVRKSCWKNRKKERRGCARSET